MLRRQYTNITDVYAKTIKTAGTGTTMIQDVNNTQLKSVKSANNKLTVADGTGGDAGTLMLNCAVDLTSTSATGEAVFAPDSAAPNFKFRRLVAGAGMQINTSQTDPLKKDALEIQCLITQAGTVTLGSSSTNGTSLVGSDSSGLGLKVRSLVSTNANMTIATDATGKEAQLTAKVTRCIQAIDVLSTGPWSATDARLSVAYKTFSPAGWSADVLPISVPALFWKGTLVDPSAVPPISLSTTGIFNTMTAGLPSNVPFSMFATVMSDSPFKLSFVFNQMAAGSIKKWNAILSRTTIIPTNTMVRIPFTLSPVTPNGVTFSTESTPRPMLDVGTTSPEGLYAVITQDILTPNPTTGSDVWILGIDLVFG
jgi:hypothetical protein